MPLTFQCSGCSSPMKAPENLAGKKVRCGRCQAVTVVPPPLVAEVIDAVEADPAGITSRPAPKRTAPAADRPRDRSDRQVDGRSDRRRRDADDVPRRRSRRDEPEPSSNLGLWIGLGAGALLLLVVVGLGAGFFLLRSGPAAPQVADVNPPVLPPVQIKDAIPKKVEEERVEPRDFWDDQKKAGNPNGNPNGNPPPKGGGAMLALNNNAAEIQGVLEQADPRDPRHGMIHKPYQVSLQANKAYVIDMIGPGFDPYLYLISPEGQIVARDDDGGDGLNSRIRYVVPRAGDYQIHAAALFGQGAFHLKVRVDDNAVAVRPPFGDPFNKQPVPVEPRGPVPAPKVEEIKLPTSVQPGGTVIGAAEAEGVTRLQFAGEKVVPDLIWTPDGATLFSLTTDGRVRRVSYPEFKIERELDIGRRCSSLAMSSIGLMVGLSDLQEVWVLDPATLDIKHRVGVANMDRVLSVPSLAIAVVTLKGGQFAFNQSQVMVVDPIKAELYPQEARANARHGILSSDGKFYFCQGGIEQLQSFHLEKNTLFPGKSTQRIASNGQSICVSPDGKWVCLPSGGGNGPGYSTFVYPSDNLDRISLTIESGAYPRTLAFDPPAQQIYAQNFDNPLLVFTDTGLKRRSIKIPVQRGDETNKFVPHPKGNKLLVVNSKAIFFVDLAKAVARPERSQLGPADRIFGNREALYARADAAIGPSRRLFAAN